MEFWIKDRSPASLLRSFNKLSFTGFTSLQEMTENEAAIMVIARELYPYIPKVIYHDYQRHCLIVEKVIGEHIGDYVIQTHDIAIIDRLKEAIQQLRCKEVALGHCKEGYLTCNDYHYNNFIVDNGKNIWFLDWDLAKVIPKDLLPSDDKKIDEFCSRLQNLISIY